MNAVEPVTDRVANTPVQDERWYRPFINVRRGLCELAAHTVMMLAILSTIRLIEKYLQTLWGVHEKVFLGIVPARYLFEAADLGLILGFLTIGIVFILKSYLTK